MVASVMRCRPSCRAMRLFIWLLRDRREVSRVFLGEDSVLRLELHLALFTGGMFATPTLSVRCSERLDARLGNLASVMVDVAESDWYESVEPVIEIRSTSLRGRGYASGLYGWILFWCL